MRALGDGLHHADLFYLTLQTSTSHCAHAAAHQGMWHSSAENAVYIHGLLLTLRTCRSALGNVAQLCRGCMHGMLLPLRTCRSAPGNMAQLCRGCMHGWLITLRTCRSAPGAVAQLCGGGYVHGLHAGLPGGCQAGLRQHQRRWHSSAQGMRMACEQVCRAGVKPQASIMVFVPRPSDIPPMQRGSRAVASCRTQG